MNESLLSRRYPLDIWFPRVTAGDCFPFRRGRAMFERPSRLRRPRIRPLSARGPSAGDEFLEGPDVAGFLRRRKGPVEGPLGRDPFGRQRDQRRIAQAVAVFGKVPAEKSL